MKHIYESLFLGNSVETWVVALAYIAGGFIAGKVVSWISSNILRSISSKTKTRLDDILLSISERPLVLLVTLAGIAIGLNHLAMAPAVSLWVGKAFIVLVTIVVAWTAAKAFDAIVTEYLVPYTAQSEGTLDDQLLPIVRKSVKIVIWLIALLLALKNTGYDVGALLAGLGLGGVAIALAAKDTLSNFFGSVAVFVDRSFAINDRVKVAGFDGTVIEIGIRTSRIRTLDNRVVTIPNAFFASSPIENVSSEPSTKVTQTIEFARSNSSEKLAEAIELLKKVGDTVSGTEPGSCAGVTAIADWSYRVTYVFFVKKGADYLSVVSAVNLSVLSSLEEAGITLAVPVQSLLGAAQKPV